MGNNRFYEIPFYEKYTISKSGVVRNYRTGKKCETAIIDGVHYTSLDEKPAKTIDLVASTFIGTPLPGMHAVLINPFNPMDATLANVTYNIDSIDHVGDKLYINGNEFRPLSFDPDYFISQNGIIYSSKMRSGFLKISIDKGNYYKIRLQSRKTRKKSMHLIHRLVYINWVGQIPLDYDIDHKNGHKWDNFIRNLEPVTRKENIRRAINIGLRDNLVRWSLDDAEFFCQCMEQNLSARDAARIMGITDPDDITKMQVAFKEIRYGLRYSDIAERYKISNYDPIYQHKKAVSKKNVHRLSKA